MGQRFQVYSKTSNNENVIGFHLQWCWGEYSLIRAVQVLDFAKGDFKSRYPIFKDDINTNDVKEVLSSLIGINHECKSYVRPYILDTDETENPSIVDNDDGCLLLDFTGDKPKYCFFDPYATNPVALSGEEYMCGGKEWRGYKYLIENHKHIQKISDKYLKKISKFEVLTTDDLIETFPKMYGK